MAVLQCAKCKAPFHGGIYCVFCGDKLREDKRAPKDRTDTKPTNDERIDRNG